MYSKFDFVEALGWVAIVYGHVYVEHFNLIGLYSLYSTIEQWVISAATMAYLSPGNLKFLHHLCSYW